MVCKKLEEVMLISCKMVEEIGYGCGLREEGDWSNVEWFKFKEGDVKLEGEMRRKVEGVVFDGVKEEMVEIIYLYVEGVRQKVGEVIGVVEQSFGDMKVGVRGQVEEVKEVGVSWFEFVKEKVLDIVDVVKQKV